MLNMSNLVEVKRKIQTLSETNEVATVDITGGSCSGKGYISCILADAVSGTILAMDDYYRGIKFIKDGNFDRPDAVDLDLLKEHIGQLRKGKSIRKPVYDFKIHARSGYEIFEPGKIIIIDGLFALHDILLNKIDVKIFVEADMKICLKRRIERDVKERGRTIESVKKQFSEIVQPMYRMYIESEKKKAGYVILNN